MEHLYDLLEECTVKLTIGQSKGTGFFVAPGLILTCNHVVCGGEESSIEVVWNNQKNLAQAEVVESFPDCDLALLRVHPPINVQQPCVHLGEDFQPFDQLYLFGYSNDFPDGCSVTIDCEGTVGGDLKLIKFKLGNVRPGMSGSPLLNKRTGYVCGIVKFNLLDGIPGGGAVATSVILGKFPDLLELQQSFHQQDQRWHKFDRERDIDWHTICNDLITEHRRQLSSNPLDVKGKSFDDVYVPLGLVERKDKQRPQIDRNLDPSADRGSELYRVEVETTPIEHDDFLQAVCDRQPGEHIVILGEPGAGKTTLLTRVWESLLAANPEAPSIVIWVPLAALGSRSLEEYVEESWLRQVCEKEDKPAYLTSLTSLRQAGKLYLLLDGADEIGGDGLKKIEEYLLQSKWAKPIKAVVTCRLNLWDGSEQNKLKQNFQIFRTLDFKYVNSVGKDEVEAFILNWFGDNTEAGRKLRTALDETGKERIKDLAQNPLRLTLLCNIWQEGEGLPDTQAGLYEQFVKYVYEWSKIPDAMELQLELDRVMGTLAKHGINKPSLRFRFTEDELQAQLPDLKDRKALKDLGWLNCVGAENRTKIYAFFHPTFQEYFAACSIDDWDYFLPRGHIDRPVLVQRNGVLIYRVFKQEWRQVILLWMGRRDKDVADERKEEFLDNLTGFHEQSGEFYYYRAYSVAAMCVGEFKSSRHAKEIVEQIAKWTISFSSAADAIGDTIIFTHREYAIAAVIALHRDPKLDEWLSLMVPNVLREIAVGNEAAIVSLLSEPLPYSQVVTSSLSEIAVGNKTAIAAIVSLLSKPSPPSHLVRALEKIAVGDETAIVAIVSLLSNPSLHDGRPLHELLIASAVKALEKITVGNETTIKDLISPLNNIYLDCVLNILYHSTTEGQQQ